MKKPRDIVRYAHLIRGALLLSLIALGSTGFAVSVDAPALPADCTWSAGPNLPSAGVRAVGVYFQGNGRFYVMGGRATDTAGSDFMHPFEFSPSTSTWTTKAATYPDNQVNNLACGVLTDSGTAFIYCVGGSAAATTTTSSRVFRYDPVSDSITVVAAPWPANNMDFPIAHHDVQR